MVASENSLRLLLLVFVGVGACGGSTERAAGATGTGGHAPSGAAGGTGDAAGLAGAVQSSAGATQSSAGGAQNAAGTGGVVTISEPICSTPTPIAPPSLASDCVVVARTVDPESTCGAADCPIIRAFDLSCEYRTYYPQLSVLDDRTLLLVTSGANAWENRLLTVTDTEREVSQVDAVQGVTYRLSNAFGTTWVVGGDWPEIVAVSANGGTWLQSTVVRDPILGSASLAAAALVDETLGYVAYRMETLDIPHLVTWDGSSWTDEILTDTGTDHLFLSVDADGLPWTAWVADGTEGEPQIVLRDPRGVTQPVYVGTQDWPGAFGQSVSMLPGGVDGRDAYPTLAFLDDNGINVARRGAGSEAGWSAVVLSESSPGNTTTDCPDTYSFDPDPCGDLTSCTTQVEGNGACYGLAHTESQGTFAVWVSYSSSADSMLSVIVEDGELPRFFCRPTETTGSGTAELVLARVGDTEPTFTRYRFDLGGGLLHRRQPVVVAARGDTLIVAAVVSGGNNPALTYFEIDATRVT